MQVEIDEGISKLNTEESSSEFNGKRIKDEYFEAESIKQEQVDIKSEEGDQFSTDEFLEKPTDHDYFDSKSIKQEESEIKRENEEGDVFNSESLIVESERGFHPTNKVACLNNFSRINMNNHGAAREEPVFKCLKCSYQTHKKELIKYHILCHMPKIFECLLCPYKSNNKDLLRKHQLVHIPKEEAKLHKCSKCTFTSKWSSCLTQHLLIHKKSDEIIWHRCPECPYKAKQKQSLVRHYMLIHKIDEPMYKCTLCSYESPRECNLQAHQKNVHGLTQHSFNYKKPNQITWYQCPECPFKTKHKNYLQTLHIWVHRNDRPMLKCTLCSCKFITKPGLQTHMKHVHRLEDIPPISCPEGDCSFKTHEQSYLKRHIRTVHKYQKILKCSNCSFETKYIRSLKAHAQRLHEKPDEWFSCPLCPYKTSYSSHLNRHTVIHKSGSGIKWFWCLECSFKSRRKDMLTQHKLKHSLGVKKISD